MSLTLITPPLGEPVPLADVKAHLRVTSDTEDALIAGYGLAARQTIEARYGLAIASQVWRLDLPCAPRRALTLPIGPVAAVEAVGIRRNGLAEALDPFDYEVHTGLVGRVRIKRALPGDAGLIVTFTAGWPDAASTPPELLLAIRTLAAHFYEHREAAGVDRFYAAPAGFGPLVAPYRQVRL